MVAKNVIAVLGATGQLGVELVKAGERRGQDVVALSHDRVEITNPESVGQAIESCCPRWVVNTVAYTDVERCETDPLKAMMVNAVGAGYVAQAAARVGARTIFISTDCVFDGTKAPPAAGLPCQDRVYREDDPVNPISIYGVSKANGERLSLGSHSDAMVARIGILFGATGARGKGGTNFIELILNRAQQSNEPVQVVADQWISPMYARDSAEAVLDVLETQDRIVHIANAGFCTWYDLAAMTLELVGSRNRVEPIPAKMFQRKAARPTNASLGCARLAGIRHRPMRSWQDGLKAYLTEKGYL